MKSNLKGKFIAKLNSKVKKENKIKVTILKKDIKTELRISRSSNLLVCCAISKIKQ